jgi:hypothetical protein
MKMGVQDIGAKNTESGTLNRSKKIKNLRAKKTESATLNPSKKIKNVLLLFYLSIHAFENITNF